MIKHIVMFRITDLISREGKKSQAQRIASIFGPLSKLESVHEYRTAINFNTTEAAWDIIIDSSFYNKEDLIRYQKSSEHQEAISRAREINKEKAVIDYEY